MQNPVSARPRLPTKTHTCSAVLRIRTGNRNQGLLAVPCNLYTEPGCKVHVSTSLAAWPFNDNLTSTHQRPHCGGGCRLCFRMSPLSLFSLPFVSFSSLAANAPLVPAALHFLVLAGPTWNHTDLFVRKRSSLVQSHRHYPEITKTCSMRHSCPFPPTADSTPSLLSPAWPAWDHLGWVTRRPHGE